MIFSLIILVLNLFLAHARPADNVVIGAIPPTERTKEDQQNDDACAPRLAQGVDHYAKCVAEKGREAEQERQRRAQHKIEINETPEPAPQMVCNPEGAMASCNHASEVAARANNPSSTDAQLNAAFQSCRAACNPESSQVLRNYLNGCRGDVSAKKQAMLSKLNNCGASSTASSEDGSFLDSFKSSVSGLADSATSYGSQAWGWLSGQAESVAAQRQAESARLLEINQTPPGYVSKLAPRIGTVNVPNGEFADSVVDDSVFVDADDNLSTPTGEQIVDDADLTTSLRPARRPDDLTGGTSGGGANGGPQEIDNNTHASTPTSTSDQQVVAPAPSEPAPVSYQAGNFAGLQQAMIAPAGGGSSSSSSMGGEVSNGGSGGSSFNSGSLNGSRPLGFNGSGQVSPSSTRPSGAPVAGVAASASVAGMDVAASSGGQRGGGLGDFGGGRMMASASRPTAQVPAGFPMSIGMRSDSYYKSSGGGGARVAANGGKPAAPCKGPNCRRAAQERTGIAASNCDGNPQCLLALTGKLRLPGRPQQGAGEVWHTSGNRIAGGSDQTGERGLASIRAKPGGVIRGKVQDVLNHIGSSAVFKLDHDGMLEVGF